MLDRLSPARRRFALATVALLVVAAVATVVAIVVSRPDPVDPVSQDELGPVVLVPGYGGSTAALDVLADALRAEGRKVVAFDPPGDGTGDLRDQAAALGRTVTDTGATSVDVVGYSAGGIVARIWVADLGGDAVARRVVTLSSPNHGTDLATVAGSLGSTACPAACQELATDSDLLRTLDSGDETPDGPRWVAIWTRDDKTVVPPDSGVLDGATSFAVQEVCPDLVVGHADMPRTPAVIAMVTAELGRADPAVPGGEVC
ncbi:alpha/beta fold hydrolase [Nocardioides sp. CN2-186]|uniref:lipase family alpha/beta hydrolase n=1 Tax=Nocardioides tweenelious TaxID=3156607 RepID=UPI0032B3B48B